MNNLFRWFCITLGVVLMMIATGCKSSKSTTTATYPIHIQQGDSANVLVSNFNQVITDYKDWNDVVVPIKLSLIEPKQLSVGGRVTMQKDQSIYISIRVLGFEAANVYVNNDSIYASYKLDKIYIAEDCEDRFKSTLKAAVACADTEIIYANTMKELGKMCNIDVGASCAVICKN